MVALQLLVVLSPAYRRPPPGTPPRPHHAPPCPAGSRSAKHGLSNRPPQTPWSRRARQGKTMLRTPAAANTDTAITAPTQRPCLSNPLPCLPWPSGPEASRHTRAAKVL